MKKPRHQITFESFKDAQCLALAQLGLSDSVIARQCELSEGQISYRLRKAKDAMGQANGFRVQWRRGESEICKRIQHDVAGILRKEAQRTLPQHFEHPTPKVSPIKP